MSAGFASNGYGAHSPGGYSLLAALVTEVVMTMMFLIIILGATDKRAPQGFAPHCNRHGSYLDSFDKHPGHEYISKPGAQHGRSPLCRRVGC